ncbi:HypC/HybG/HupF family hydrogenase formation chaperone [Patescibacteria group bacterium]|nr:HypC/HybG/HupF family hydrogenase formation chaperone [Patescibacteria group bacterium]
MCLAIPGKIKSIDKKTHHATVSFNGIEKNINIEVVDANIGDYVVVHAGYAIEKLDRRDAKKTLKLFEKSKLQNLNANSNPNY